MLLPFQRDRDRLHVAHGFRARAGGHVRARRHAVRAARDRAPILQRFGERVVGPCRMTCPSCTYASSDVSDNLRSVVSTRVLAKGARQFGANPPPQTRPTSFRQWNAPSFASASRSRPLAWRHAARGIGNAVPGDDRNAAATRDGPRVLCKPASTRSDAKVARTCASPSAYAYAPTTTRVKTSRRRKPTPATRESPRARREVGAAPRLRIRRIRFRERHVERACFRARRFGDGLLELRALARDDGDVRAEAEQRDERAQLGRAAEKREEGVSQIGTGPVVASRSERFERVDDVRLDAAVFGPAPCARDRGVAEKTFAFALDRHRVRAFRGVRAVLASAASDDLGA